MSALIADALKVRDEVGDSLFAVTCILSLVLVVEAGDDLAGRLSNDGSSFGPLDKEHWERAAVTRLEICFVASEVVLHATKPKTPRRLLTGLDGRLQTCCFVDVGVLLCFAILLQDFLLVVL